MRINQLAIFTAILFFGVFQNGGLFAQNPVAGSAGSVKGKVKDSIYNFMLTSASVAIYKDADSALVKYTLPNNFGEFTLESLPTGLPLKLIITHVGYKPVEKKITISESKPVVDLGLIYLEREMEGDKQALEEVVVTAVAPMRMNGDTLEFNAAAFKLEPNATAEDLMRMLQGVTIWGDGEITFNGKKINQLLVNGKPFMGSSDPSIATQNIPKDAINKIQVYQQRDEKNPLDSTMFANIKLKEDKKMGYFGKAGGGYGSDQRYTADAMISGFNKNLQVSAVGGVNNINKMANGIDQLVKSSSYKGEGTNIDYQSDFNMKGVNRPVAAGVKMQYDFIPDPGYMKKSRWNADYFFNRNQALVNNNTRTENYLSTDAILMRNSLSNSNNISTDQRFNSGYEFSNENLRLDVNASLTSNYDKNLNESQSEQSKTGIGVIGTNISSNEKETYKNGLNAGFNFTKRNRWESKQRIPTEFSFGYHFSTDQTKGNSRKYSKFNSETTPSNNKEFDRFYEQSDRDYNGHNFNFRYPGIKKLIFNKHSFGGIEMGISSSYALNNNNSKERVLDLDTSLKKYILNHYLTNDRNVRTTNLMPSFELTKSIHKGLTNRYNKYIFIRVNLTKQFYAINSKAAQSAQDFSYQYQRFVPNASIEYRNHQYGTYEAAYNLNFSTKVSYPGVNNIAPLVDSSNLWYVPKGNLNIKPAETRALSFGYEFNTRKSRNPLRINLTVEAGKTDNSISDSTIYDGAGVRSVYAVNMEGSKYLNSSLRIRKSLELKNKNTIELDARFTGNLNRDPQYINSVLNLSNNQYKNMRFNIGYRHKDFVNIKAEQGISISNSKQTGFNDNSFKSLNQYSRFIGTLQFPKNLLWSTNITNNKSVVNNKNDIFYTIWNASLTYRFLKGNRGEVKFAALDLLHQNKGIVNSISGSTQTYTTSNVLQQYFLLTVSYFPRKFGK